MPQESLGVHSEGGGLTPSTSTAQAGAAAAAWRPQPVLDGAATGCHLLGSAAAAHVKGRLADQLQAALAHRALIEQAKGVLMERKDLDLAAAFERLRVVARSSSRKVADIARDVLADVPPVSARP